jgi:hypothetical protein
LNNSFVYRQPFFLSHSYLRNLPYFNMHKAMQSKNNRSKVVRRANLNPRSDSQLTVLRPSDSEGQVVHAKSTIYVASVTSTSAAEGLYGYSTSFDQIPDYTSCQNLYDRYKINRVVWRIKANTAQPVPAASPSISYLFACVDFDDGSAPSSVSIVGNYENCVLASVSEDLLIEYRPKIAIAAYSGAFTSYASNSNQWIDMGSPSVQHYGLKIGVSQSTSTNVNNWLVFVTIHYSMSHRR